jgi:hypothetical protein
MTACIGSYTHGHLCIGSDAPPPWTHCRRTRFATYDTLYPPLQQLNSCIATDNSSCRHPNSPPLPRAKDAAPPEPTRRAYRSSRLASATRPLPWCPEPGSRTATTEHPDPPEKHSAGLTALLFPPVAPITTGCLSRLPQAAGPFRSAAFRPADSRHTTPARHTPPSTRPASRTPTPSPQPTT